jgi:hypothetical protein
MIADEEIMFLGQTYKNPFPFLFGPLQLLALSPAITHVFTPRGGWQNWIHLFYVTEKFLPFILFFGLAPAIILGRATFFISKNFSLSIRSNIVFYVLGYLVMLLPTLIVEMFTLFYTKLFFKGFDYFTYPSYILYSIISIATLISLRSRATTHTPRFEIGARS